MNQRVTITHGEAKQLDRDALGEVAFIVDLRTHRGNETRYLGTIHGSTAEDALQVAKMTSDAPEMIDLLVEVFNTCDLPAEIVDRIVKLKIV